MENTKLKIEFSDDPANQFTDAHHKNGELLI